MSCPDANTLAAFGGDSLAAALRAEIADHAATCETCHAAIASILDDVGSDPTIDASSAEPTGKDGRHVAQGGANPVQIGRYRIGGKLGTGAMGVVYSAYDPDLDRPVAIKLLKRGACSDRLRREAQSLGQLSHPNVVGVYDVGAYDEGTFVAMALVDGTNLREWLRAPRTTEAIIEVIAQAACGVVAAHAAGIVHRDLKPDNIFVSRRGEVLVGDFGLARPDNEPTEGVVRGQEVASTLTRSGTLLGTPAYMAPEQVGGDASAASDQFSLCVTAWEALFGSRPFEGRTIGELVENAQRGEIVAPKSTRRVASRLVRALRRGLAGDPDARHASVAVLRDALRLRRRRWPAVLGGALTIAGLVATLLVMSQTEHVDPCGDPGSLAKAWSWTRRLELAAALTKIRGAGPGFGTAVLARIDRYVTTWADVRHQSCLAAQVRHEQRVEAAEQIVRCLDRRATTARNLFDALGSDPDETAAQALSKLEGLPAVERCRDTDASSRAGSDPARDKLEELLAVLVLKQTAADTGLLMFDLEAMVQSARAAGDDPVLARALAIAGSAQLARWNMDAAESYLKEALGIADRAGADLLRAEVAATLAVLFVRSARLREAATHRDLAASALERGGPDPAVDVVVERATAMIAYGQHEASAEIASLRRVVKLQIAQHGSVSLAAATAWGDLADALQRANDREYERAFAEQARAYAPLVTVENHTLYAADQAGTAAMVRGDHATSIQQTKIAASLARRAPSPTTPLVIQHLAMAYEGAGVFAEAHRAYLEAVVRVDAAPIAQRDLTVLADSLEGAGRTAAEMAERSDEGAANKTQLAIDSLRLTDRALVIAGGLGEAYAAAVDALQAQRGRALVALHRWKDAVPILRAALERAESEQPQRPYAVAMRSFMLARALWEVGDQRDRRHARALAEHASHRFAQARAQVSTVAALGVLKQMIDRQAARLSTWRKAHR